MAQADFLLYDKQHYPIEDISCLKIGIVRSEWNTQIVDALTQSCTDELLSLGLDSDLIHVRSVPGSFELPLGAKFLLNSPLKLDAVICLGCVIQGETKHDEYINHTIARGIAQLGLMTNKPVIYGVLTTNTLEQAQHRAGGKRGDKGKESAHAVLKMISLQEQLSNKGSKIKF